jgi:alpha-tubulin suppressor-like RCC1 family protein
MDPFGIITKPKRYFGTRGTFNLSDITEKYFLSDDDELSPENKYEEIVPSGFLTASGLNDYGQLGQSNTINQSSPVFISGSQWVKCTAGKEFTLAIKNDGTLWSWGRNDTGQLGLGDTINRSSPAQIPGILWKDVIAPNGGNHVMALRNDGTLWSWGDNAHGQLGQNDKLNRFSPVQIPGTGWKELGIGLDWSSSLKEDGSVVIWGNNDHGQLGLNDRIDRSSPTQLGGNDWVKIGRFGGQHNAAIKSDGYLYTWGNNGHGALGQYFGSFGSTNLSSPTQISGHRGWTYVAGGQHHTVGIKDDRTYWGWGHNNYGQSGLLSSPTTLEYPYQGRNYNVKFASGGRLGTYLIESGNCLRSTGRNADGQLGQLNVTDTNSPVQTAGQGWVAGGGSHVAIIDALNLNIPKQTL